MLGQFWVKKEGAKFSPCFGVLVKMHHEYHEFSTQVLHDDNDDDDVMPMKMVCLGREITKLIGIKTKPNSDQTT